jgi:GWxTD domain-containing protein
VKVALVVGLLLAAASASPAADFPARALGRPAFVVDVDVAAFAADSADVEVSWQVPLHELAFQPEDGVFRARYDVAAVFTAAGRQAAAQLWERRLRATTLGETREPSAASRGRRPVRLAWGKYELRVTMTDRVSGARAEAVGRFEAKPSVAEIGLSDLRLVRYTGEAVERNVSHDVPLDAAGHFVRASVRAESAPEGEILLRWRMAAPGGATLAEGDSTVALAGATLTVDLPLPAQRLVPGTNTFEVRLGRGGNGGRREIEIHARLTREWLRSRRDDALEIARLLAESAEVESLRSAEGTAWSDSLNAFLARRDPSPETAENEFVRTLLERLETASTNFVEPFRQPGWRTDRGRIWVRYGPPSRRTTSSGDFDRPATEVWEYDSPKRVFFFVDRGSGEFWLSG